MKTGILKQCLDDLASRFDDADEDRRRQEWIQFLDNRCPDDVFVPRRRTPRPARFTWPAVTVNQAIADPEAMLIQQFAWCSNVLAHGDPFVLCVRCNYGIGILPTVFGCELFMMEESTGSLPTALPVGGRDRIEALVNAGVPNVRTGLGAKVFETAERFQAIFAEYPSIARNVALYHPDWQGPIDVAEVVWGSDLFYAFPDEPELVKRFLKLVTDTYAAAVHEWCRTVGAPGRYTAHWGCMQRGFLMLRNDSLMNLSADTYVELIRPMDQRLLDEFGGGGIHFCGRGSHFIAAMSELRGLTGIAMSQPELNDMDTILDHTVDKGIKLLGYPWDKVPLKHRPLHGQLQHW